MLWQYFRFYELDLWVRVSLIYDIIVINYIIIKCMTYIASSLSQLWPHTVPHVVLSRGSSISTLPSCGYKPPTSRMSHETPRTRTLKVNNQPVVCHMQHTGQNIIINHQPVEGHMQDPGQHENKSTTRTCWCTWTTPKPRGASPKHTRYTWYGTYVGPIRTWCALILFREIISRFCEIISRFRKKYRFREIVFRFRKIISRFLEIISRFCEIIFRFHQIISRFRQIIVHSLFGAQSVCMVHIHIMAYKVNYSYGFGWFSMRIGSNNEHLWLPRGYTSDFDHYLNLLQFDTHCWTNFLSTYKCIDFDQCSNWLDVIIGQANFLINLWTEVHRCKLFVN